MSAIVFASGADEIAARVFLAIAVVVVVARVMGALARRVGQPAVIGEIIAGILLGPTLLGAFPGDLDEVLFPPEIRSYLSVVAELGLIVFMFIVGLELDLRLIRGKERLAGVVSLVSVALPFALGGLLAVSLYSSHKVVNNEDVEFLPFALFIGASMSVTAFPVLARILTERGMHRTEVGALTLACAAVDDILAWSLLAVVIAVVEAGSALDLPRILGLSLAYVMVMFLVVRPRLARISDRFREVGRLTPGIMSVVLVGILVSSFITWKIGIHAIFGAFLFGVIMPKEDTAELLHQLLERLESVSVQLLLPVFFIVTGLSVNIRGIDAAGYAQLALILLVACAGKFFGASAAARFQGIPPRKAATIGVLMNTRGLTELVILNIGLAAGVLSDDLFTMLVIMAIATTVIAAPALRITYPDALLQRDIEEAERAALGERGGFRVYVPVVREVSAIELRDTVHVAIDIAGPGSELVIARFLPRARQLEVGSGLADDLAAMASTLDELHEIEALAEARGVNTTVRSQFSSEPAADLAEQASRLGTEIVVLPRTLTTHRVGDLDFVTTMLDRASADVASVEGGGGGAPNGAIRVRYGETSDDSAAVEVAARIARATRRPLAVEVPPSPGRRASRQIESMREVLANVAVDVHVERDGDVNDDSTSWFVAAADRSGGDGATTRSPSGAVAIRVWARPSLDGEPVSVRLSRLVADVPAEHPVAD